MADVKISALPAASTPLDGTELVPIVQSGVTEQVTVANLTAGRTVAAGTVNVDANTANAAVRITQTGAGNAFVVEDSTNPDSSPFVIGPDGEIRIGFTGSVPVGSGVARQFQSIVLGDPAGGSGGASFSRFSNDASGAVFALGKSRGTSASQFTVVSNGDSLGAIRWAGSDGTDLISQAAEIRADVDGTPGNDDMPGRLVFSTTADGASSPTERMRIGNTGNIGIGTVPAPSTRLVVAGPTDSPQAAATDGSINQYMGYCGFGSAFSGTSTNHPYVLLVNNSERMRITTAGNVGIGTSTPGALLNVVANTSTDAVRITQTGTGNALVVEDSANPDATPVVVDANGEVILGTTLARSSYAGLIPKLQIHGIGNNNVAASITDWQTTGFGGPFFNLDKSKGGAVGTRGIVASNDRLGWFTYSGDDGTNFIPAARIEAFVDGIPGTNDMPGRLVFSTTPDGSNTPAERMRITSAGNVVAGGSVALATTATDGFLYVPTCAGVPTGTPTTITGMAPIVVNTTNNKLYFYSGGAWRDAGP